MDDGTLFALGCGVTFLFLMGGYVLFRATFMASTEMSAQEE